MPARRKQKRSRSKRVKTSRGGRTGLYLVVTLFLFLGLYFFVRRPDHLWDGETRLTLVAQEVNGNVTLLNFDPANQSITRIQIPGETQVQVAYQLGTWRLKSVGRLGEQEGVYGEVLAKTIVKTFQLPVEAWGEAEALSLGSANGFDTLKAIWGRYKTNLTFWDRVNLAFFSFATKARDRSEISLIDTGYIYEERLVDGPGFAKRERVPASFAGLFADSALSEENLRVAVNNMNGEVALTKNLVSVIEIMGARVVSTRTRQVEGVDDCVVVGKDSLTKTKIQTVFSCPEGDSDLGGEFDVELILGEGFSQRF